MRATRLLRQCPLMVMVLVGGGRAMCGTATATQTLSVSVAPIGKLSVPATLTLTHTGAIFNPYTGSVTVAHKIRTTPTSGSGSIAVQAAEFSPATGPQISNG